MKNNGKISKFLQDHGIHLVCLVALLFGIAYGIHACKNALDININARRNNITTTIQKNR